MKTLRFSVFLLISVLSIMGCASTSATQAETDATTSESTESTGSEEMKPAGPLSAEDAEWMVFDASSLPLESDPVLYESNVKGNTGETLIVNDPAIAGNSLLQLTTPEGPDNKICYTVDIDMIQAVGATIVFRAKAIEGYEGNMAFDIEFRTGIYRDRLIGFSDGRIKLDKAKVSGEFDPSGWNIVRLALSEAEDGTLDIQVYLNEDSTALLSGTSATEHGDNLFRFGDGSGNDFAASQYDWVVWTNDGAYAPGEWLPEGLPGM